MFGLFNLHLPPQTIEAIKFINDEREKKTLAAKIGALTFSEVAAAALALETALADREIRGKDNWLAEVAARVIVAAKEANQ